MQQTYATLYLETDVAKRPTFTDISGQRFGRLLVLNPVEPHITSGAKFACLCDCGNTKDIVGRSLTKGFTVSCGCYRNERVRETNSTHKATSVVAAHEYARAYKTYRSMLSRCYGREGTTTTKNYRDRGIKVCDRWHDFEAFYLDMYPKPEDHLTLERVDVNGDYSPENCIWADMQTQANNKTTSVFLEAFGRRQTGPQWAREFGIKYHTIRARIYAGWSIEDAISRPLVEAGQHKVTKLEARGKTKTVYEWAREVGVAAPTIMARIKRGESVEQAIFRELTRRNHRQAAAPK